MAESAPDPHRILAVLLGASSFRRAPKLAQGRAFYNSAQDFHEYLMESGALGLPRENVHWLFDDSRSPSDQLQDIGDFLESRCAALKNSGTPPQDLIVYYVGHGLFSGSDQSYCLAVRATDERNEGLTSIRASDLASVVKAQARFLRKLLILDCCFSAAAYKEFQSGPLQVGRAKLLDEFPQKGTTLLCSASARDPSLAPEGLSRTMFSDALLKALRRGHPSLGPRLSLSELGDLVKVNIQEAYPDTGVRPEVHSPDQREGDVASVRLFPNAAYQAQKTKAEEQARKQRQQAITMGRNEAAALVRAGDLQGAITVLDKLLEQHPNSVEIQEDREAAATELARQQREAEARAEREAKEKARRKASKEPQPGAERVNPKDQQPYVWIPPGEFLMGAPDSDQEAGDDEKPQHLVKITKGFWLGQTPVTVAAYKRFARATKREMPGAPYFNPGWSYEDHPIVNVTWDGAVAYCEWAGGRLPTEAEWEYAARAENRAPRYGELDQIAWYWSNSGHKTHPVGEKLANAWNLYDTLGNVWEWVADWYQKDHYRKLASSVSDPKGPAEGSWMLLELGRTRVLRGGSWDNYPGLSAHRAGTGMLRSTGTASSGSGAPGKCSLDSFFLFRFRTKRRRSKPRLAGHTQIRRVADDTLEGFCELRPYSPTGSYRAPLRARKWRSTV